MNQKIKILTELQHRQPGWVSTYVLAKSADSLSVHSRIADLRREGWKITSRPAKNKVQRYFYKLGL